MRESLYDFCIHYDQNELLLQWDQKKNEDLTPKQISYGSHQKVWWKCEKGHEWQSPPYIRTGKNAGCPYCAGKKVAPGSDLRTNYPQIAAQWHRSKNGKLRPEDCLPGSHRSVWWQCSNGHEWKALIKSRIEGNGCPYCSNRAIIAGENDLNTMVPAIAKQWHPTKNGPLTPERVSIGSSRRVWWQCERGHEWQASISSRVEGRGCPVCAGKVIIPGDNDLQSYAPDLAKQWHPSKNGSLGAHQVAVNSNRRVWWQCERGHEWQATISLRSSRRSGCPYCTNRKVLPGFNDLQTVQPMVAAQWHPKRNAPLEPDQVLPGSTKRVWWRCMDGHEWKAVIYSRTGERKCGCPYCLGRKRISSRR